MKMGRATKNGKGGGRIRASVEMFLSFLRRLAAVTVYDTDV